MTFNFSSIFIFWLLWVCERAHLVPAQNSTFMPRNFIHHPAFTFSIPLSDCFRLPVRDRSYPTIVILWPRRIDIGADKAAADFVPRRDCPRMISDPSSSGVKNSEEQPSWLLPRIWNVSREILRRFRSRNVSEII